MKRNKILIGCFALSLFTHFALLVLFQRYSLWFSAPAATHLHTDWLSFMDKKERDEILQAAFEPVEEELLEVLSVEPQEETVLALPTHSKEKMDINKPLLFQNTFSFALDEALIRPPLLPTFTIPSGPSLHLLDHLPKDLIVPAFKKDPLKTFLPFPTQSGLCLSKTPPPVPVETEKTQVFHSAVLRFHLTESPEVAKPPKMIPLPDLPKLPTLDELETSSFSDSFDADLVFLPKSEGDGYFFALTLVPGPNLALPRLRQHITFLLDRSNSVQQNRLNATKLALQKAFDFLEKEDTFNMIAFDSKMEKMSPNPLTCTPQSFAVGEEFLDKILLGSFFSTADLHHPLLQIVPKKVEKDEVHTTILISNGESLSKKGAARSLLYDWTRYNAGKVSLFILGMNDPNTCIFETLTALNRGKVFTSHSYRGLKRKLSKLLKTIHNPVAKNMVCHAISKSPQAKVTLFPQGMQTPCLYLEQPYVILGETDSLDDFILFVQGRLKGRWLNIKKTISFLNAKKGSKALRQELALQKAYHLCEQFVLDLDPNHLVEAEALVKPFDLEVIFR